MLNEAERARIAEAVRRAEAGTAGEIVVVLSARAASYRSVPLLYGLVVALLVPWPLLWLSSVGTSRLLLIQLVAALVAVAAAAPLGIRHHLVPHAIRHRRAREAAQRAFADLGIARTRGRTGVLLYLAEAERHAEIIGDAAIASRIDEGEWRALIEDLVATLHRSGAAEALVAAIARIGAILARHVPAAVGEPDELSNDVIVS